MGPRTCSKILSVRGTSAASGTVFEPPPNGEVFVAVSFSAPTPIASSSAALAFAIFAASFVNFAAAKVSSAMRRAETSTGAGFSSRRARSCTASATATLFFNRRTVRVFVFLVAAVDLGTACDATPAPAVEASEETDAVASELARRRTGAGGASAAPAVTSAPATRRTVLRGFFFAPPPPPTSSEEDEDARWGVDVAAFCRRDVDGTLRHVASVQES